MKAAATEIESWEYMAEDRTTWRHLIKDGIQHAENTRNTQQVEKRNVRKVKDTVAPAGTIFQCERCKRISIYKLDSSITKDVVSTCANP